jgi:hypothetical protein
MDFMLYTVTINGDFPKNNILYSKDRRIKVKGIGVC